MRASLELVETRLVDPAFDLDNVRLLEFTFAGGQMLDQLTVVGQNDQPDGVVIERGRTQQLVLVLGQHVENGRPPLGIAGSTDDAARLVHQQVNQRCDLFGDMLAVNQNVVFSGIDKARNFHDKLAIYRDSPVEDHLFHGPP